MNTFNETKTVNDHFAFIAILSNHSFLFDRTMNLQNTILNTNDDLAMLLFTTVKILAKIREKYRHLYLLTVLIIEIWRQNIIKVPIRCTNWVKE